jgi:N-methylhydantoinase B/oxoprolinase/acetone carboxylase alpha subunit
VSIDRITLSVIGGAFVAIGHEMGHALKRMAYSPAAQQVEDIGGGLFTVDGKEICESDTTPLHIGSIPAYIRGFMRRLEGKIDEGDIVIHNHPYHGASHSPDLCVAIPVFWEGEHVAWSASTIHLSDTGGVFPGIALDVHDVWAESKLYDSLKLYERGVRNETLWQFFLDNTRTPTYVQGDTEAMIATGRLGERRMHELLARYGMETVLGAVDEWLSYCERMMREQLAKAPDGTWNAVLWLDDDGRNRGVPLRVEVDVTIAGDEITVDLSKSNENVPTGYNVPFEGSTLPGIYTIVRSIFLDEASFEEFIPQNDGIFRPIKVVAKEGTIFNPSFPRSALARATQTNTAADAVMRALADVVPDKICAGTSALSASIYAGYLPAKQEYWVHIEINEGAYGGRLGKDGIDAVDVLIANSRNTPIEEIDWLFPLRTERYELRPDPPAPGRWRGGIGIVRVNRYLEDGVVTMEAEGTYEAPWGIFGGHDGHPLRLTRLDPDGSREPLYSKMTNVPMPKGTAIEWMQASAGGYGDPLEREPVAVLGDVLDELVTFDDARGVYGVVIDLAAGTVDLEATMALRAGRRGR